MEESLAWHVFCGKINVCTRYWKLKGNQSMKSKTCTLFWTSKPVYFIVWLKQLFENISKIIIYQRVVLFRITDLVQTVFGYLIDSPGNLTSNFPPQVPFIFISMEPQNKEWRNRATQLRTFEVFVSSHIALRIRAL